MRICTLSGSNTSSFASSKAVLGKEILDTADSSLASHPSIVPSPLRNNNSRFEVLSLSCQCGVKMEDGENDDAKRLVFVTVGTTSFDALVNAVVSDNVKEELHKRGYTRLLIQMGRGIYSPPKCDGADGSLAVDYFTFSLSIADYIQSASLVISHAGSGSIFETLKLGKPLIVRARREEAFVLRSSSHASSDLDEDVESLVRYTPGDGTPVARIIDRFLGFPDD
ncbi:hypothetical protein Bca4012_056019 [Brassica carinata]